MTVSTQNEPVILVGTFAERASYTVSEMPIGYMYFARDAGPNGTLYVVDIVGSVRSWKPAASAAAATLAQVLLAGNVSGASDILMDTPQALDASTPAALKLGTGNATSIAMGNALGAPNSNFQLFINQGGVGLSSNAGIQYSSTFANRGSIRVNQYGAHDGVPGITGFKSRGATVGADASVLVGDTLARMTAIGIPGNGVDRPLSGIAGFQVTAVNPNFLGTQFAVETVADDGGINSHRETFAVAGSGLLRVREDANSMSGIIDTGPGGAVTVNNTRITANTRIELTIQDGGAVPTGSVYVSTRVVGTSFTIQSMAGDVGVRVYYQLWEPL